MTKYTTAELNTKIENALRGFFCEDIDLLCHDAHEISITHKLAEHLQHQFGDLKVDCEYNRLGDDPKELPDNSNRRPDIVVHKRGCKGSNTLVVEVKKSNSDDRSDDDYKLREFTRESGCYEYELGLFLVFDVENKVLECAEFYQDGEKIEPCYCGSLLKKFGSTTSGQQIDD